MTTPRTTLALALVAAILAGPAAAGQLIFYQRSGQLPVGSQSAAPSQAPAAQDRSALSLSTPAVSGKVGSALSSRAASASGGAPPYTFAASGAFPPGLALDPSSGTLSGTPNQAGTYRVTMSVTDSAGATATSPLAVTVTP